MSNSKHVGNGHVSAQRREETEKKMRARLNLLIEILRTEKIPDGFTVSKSIKAFCLSEFPKLGWSKISVNTARGHHLWDELDEKRLKVLQLEEERAATSETPSDKPNSMSKGSRGTKKVKPSELGLKEQNAMLVDEALAMRAMLRQMQQKLNSKDAKLSSLQTWADRMDHQLEGRPKLKVVN